MMYGEAVVFCDRSSPSNAKFVRKQLAQLPSKARYISAQFLALLEGDLWLELATHANAMAALLATKRRRGAGGAAARAARWSTACSRRLRPDAIEALQKWCFFYMWDEAAHEVRWMTAWDTAPADVDAFVAGVQAVLAH